METIPITNAKHTKEITYSVEMETKHLTKMAKEVKSK